MKSVTCPDCGKLKVAVGPCPFCPIRNENTSTLKSPSAPNEVMQPATTAGSSLGKYFTILSCLVSCACLFSSFYWHDPWQLGLIPVTLVFGSFRWCQAAIGFCDRLERNSKAFSATVTILPLLALGMFFALVGQVGFLLALAWSAGCFALCIVSLGAQELLYRFHKDR